MPSPAAMEEHAALIARIAEEARTTCLEQEAESKAKGEEQEGEGWTASAWLTTHKVTDVIGEVLMSFMADDMRSSSAELAFFRGMSTNGSKELLLSLLQMGKVAEALADKLWPKFVELTQAAAASASEMHSKFVEEGVGFDLEYADLKSFFGGLEAVVGSPNPSVLQGMQREHCHETDSIEPFMTSNYKMSTTSRIEWWFVFNPTSGLKELRIDKWPSEAPETVKGSARPRQALPLSLFEPLLAEKNQTLKNMEAQLIEQEELIGCRMYTGPVFVKYNSVLRGLQSSIAFFKNDFLRLCKGNKYTTTLHVINSAVVKLSKLTFAKKVYRGVSGGRLPKNFRLANDYGVRGGIDTAFMSTTTDREVAMHYAASRGGPGVVYEMKQGMIDRGADIGWMSQYPHEREILFAPLTGLEIQKLSVEGSVLVPEVRLSINLNAATIGDVIGRRRKLLKDMGDNMAVEVSAALSGSGFEETSVRMLHEDLDRDALAKEVMWYNEEENFQQGVALVIGAKRSSLSHEERLAWLVKQPSELVAHVEPIVRLLRDPVARVRRAALEALGVLAAVQEWREIANMPDHVHAMVPLLRDEDEGVRVACVDTLGKVPPAALGIEAQQIQLQLDHATQKPDVRRACIRALGQLDSGKLAQYASAIVSRIADADGQVRRAVIEALGHLHSQALLPHAPSVIAKLEDEKEDVRAAVVTTVGRIASELNQKQTRDIQARLRNTHGGVRVSALRLLGKFEPARLATMADVLVSSLKDKEQSVRTVALDVMSLMHPGDLAKHKPDLALRLRDESAEVRYAAVSTMGNLDVPDLGSHLPMVVERLDDDDRHVRSMAVGTLLSKLDVTDLAAHVTAIVDRIEDEDDGVRRSAMMWATTKLDATQLSRHSHIIAKGLSDPIVSVRRAALEALSKVDASVLTQYAHLLVGRLDDKILSVRCAAIGALARLEPADLVPHTEALIRALRDPEWTVRALVVETFGKFPRDVLSERCVQPHVLDAMEDAFDGVRSAAAGVMGGLLPEHLAMHAPAVVQRLEHPKPTVRTVALAVLDGLEPDVLASHAPAVVKLLEPPEDKHKMVQMAALSLLAGLYEHQLHGYLPTINRYIEDADDGVRAAAYEALNAADPSGNHLGHSISSSAPGAPPVMISPMRGVSGVLSPGQLQKSPSMRKDPSRPNMASLMAHSSTSRNYAATSPTREKSTPAGLAAGPISASSPSRSSWASPDSRLPSNKSLLGPQGGGFRSPRAQRPPAAAP